MSRARAEPLATEQMLVWGPLILLSSVESHIVVLARTHLLWRKRKRSILYVFFWVFPRRLVVVCRRFGRLYLFHLQRLDMKCEVLHIFGVWLLYADVSEHCICSIFIGWIWSTVLHIQPMKMEQIECSETSAYNNQTPGKYPKEYIQDSKLGESLKSSKRSTLRRPNYSWRWILKWKSWYEQLPFCIDPFNR